MFNALMPGEHDYLKGKPMPGQAAAPMAQPAKKRGPIMNALSGYLQFAAPEQYEAGRQARFGRDIGNALANEDYGTASKLKMQSGDFEGGLKIKDYASGMDAEKRKAEARSTYQLFTSMQPLQINEMAMSDPAGFEQYTGMTSEEYLQTAQRLQQAGMTPEQFHQFVLEKAQAELGMAPAEKKPYQAVTDAYGRPVAFDPNQGSFGDAYGGAKPGEANGIIYDPMTVTPLADFRTPAQSGETTDYQQEQLRLEAARLGISEAELMLKIAQAEQTAASGTQRKYEKDPNGVLRYVDTGEPVFPDVETAPKPAKPLIGAESMARVAAGLPTAKQAVAGIRSLVFNSKGTMLSAPGYDPGNDFGAGVIQDLGYFPVVGGAIRGATEPLSRIVGGADYQKFEDSYSAYEAAILPIMSGAAVTDTEALRQLRAVRIKSGDNKETKERKVKAMELQVQGLEMAARGDVDGFLGLLDQAGEIAGTGPVKRDGTTAAPAPKPTGAIAPEFEGYTLDGDPITEDDIQTTMRENGMTREQVVAALMGEGQ